MDTCEVTSLSVSEVVPFFCTLLIWNQPIFLCLVFSHPCKLYSEMPINYEIWNYVTWIFRVKVWTLEAFECWSNHRSRLLKSQDIGQSRERNLFIVTTSGRWATEASDLQVHLQGLDMRLGFKWRTQSPAWSRCRPVHHWCIFVSAPVCPAE